MQVKTRTMVIGKHRNVETENPENKKAAVFMLRPLFKSINPSIHKFRNAIRAHHAPKIGSQ
jgi:hypothetical protein